MNIVCEQECKELVRTSLEDSMSYQAYTELIDNLANENASSGEDQSEEKINFTRLNHKRMKRWDKTLKITDDVKETIEELDKDFTWLVLTETWCGDAAHLLPAINKVASLSNHIKLRTVLRDKNPELMNNFLTNGTKSIPKLIMIDDATGKVVNTYCSRPELLTKMVNEYKEMHGKLTPEFKEEIQKWYNKDKGQTIANELLDLLYV